MFGIGAGELVIVAIVILLAVGPTRMPTMMRAVGRAMREFRKATQDLRAQSGIDELLREDFDLRKGVRRAQPKAQPLTTITEETIRAERPEEGIDVDWERRHGATSGNTTEPEG
jgi:Tat protein translocase TatB subunit